MSQQKVDQYKKEKKNREKIKKKKRTKKVLAALLGALLLGACIGFPLGKYIYKTEKARAAANATIEADVFDLWFNRYWSANYAELISTDTDASFDYNDYVEDTEAENAE